MQCPSCREELSDKFSFCPYCGTRLQPTFCPACKARSVPGARFCAYCGSNLSEPSKEEKPEWNAEEEMKMQNTAMDSLFLNLMSDNPAEDGEEEEQEFDSSSPDAWELSFLTDFK